MPVAALDSVDVVFASNRGPLSFERSPTGSLETREGVGAVAEIIDTVARSRTGRTTWIACPVSPHDYAAVESGFATRSAADLPYGAVHVLPDRSALRGYYDGMSNRILWPACHDLWDDVGVDTDDWEGSLRAYDEVNGLVAAAVVEHSSETDLVFLHDYHVLTAAEHVRRSHGNRRIVLFLHVPWLARGFSRLPERLAAVLVRGMLGADLIGFQTRNWMCEFLRTCEELGYRIDADRRSVRVGRSHRSWLSWYPVPIAPETIERLSRTSRAERWATAIDRAVSRPLIARVDRIEPSKNQLRGFEAFEVAQGEDGIHTATFVAALIPRRADIAVYRDCRAALEDKVKAINRARPRSVRLLVGENRERALALLRLYDVLLVNSVADGMNLVAKEGALLNQCDGVLVLSKTVGAAVELEAGAIVVDDPRDVAATARALSRAVSLPAAERATRAAVLKRAVAQRSPAAWFREQVDDLLHIREHGAPRAIA